MATADTARLVAELTLNDKGFTKGLSNAEKKLGSLESTSFRVGQNIGNGVKTGLANIGKLGLVAAGGISLAVKSGINDLAELENATTSVDGAIKQLGLTGQLTGKQVADWANQIEADVDAAFDDKAITQAATTLLRFGKVTPKNLERTLEVMTDLAAKTGDVDSAATLLAKSLADPTKAAGKLARQGIILTKAQQDQIKAMTEAGDVAGAQALLLDAVAKSTEGAAKAMAGPYQDAINKTNDALEDAKKALAVGFLPVITKTADKLSQITADPKALANIQAFGKTLAGGLDSLISIAERLPWDAIGTSLQVGGMGAKAILDAFVGLPPWVQTAVLTGWGLNKLTGGALTGIAGELAKGLTKGLTGNLFDRGSSPANPLWVQSVGGGVGGGGPTPASGAGGALRSVAATASGVVILGVAQSAATDLTTALAGRAAGQIQKDVGSGPVNLVGPLDRLMRALQGDFRSGAEVAANTDKMIGKFDVLGAKMGGLSQDERETKRAADQVAVAVHNASAQDRTIAASNQAAAFAIRDRVATSGSLITGAVNSVKAATDATKAAAAAAGQQTAAAVRDKDLSVDVRNTVNVSTSVSVRSTIGATQKVNKYTTIL